MPPLTLSLSTTLPSFTSTATGSTTALCTAKRNSSAQNVPGLLDWRALAGEKEEREKKGERKGNKKKRTTLFLETDISVLAEHFYTRLFRKNGIQQFAGMCNRLCAAPSLPVSFKFGVFFESHIMLTVFISMQTFTHPFPFSLDFVVRVLC